MMKRIFEGLDVLVAGCWYSLRDHTDLVLALSAMRGAHGVCTATVYVQRTRAVGVLHSDGTGSLHLRVQRAAARKRVRKRVRKPNKVKWLRALGFDNSRYAGNRKWAVRCSMCEAAVINGVPCHEQGCGNQPRVNDDE